GDAGTITFFAVNRNGEEALDVAVAIEGFGAVKSVEHTLIRHDDLEATNTQDAPDTVAPQQGNGARMDDGTLTLSLPPYSYSMFRVQL
ncbi:MAG: alpha-L-arabinofuranosidase C-terminal domain-containing protein, partial [Paracoccaceae bacterium]